MDGAWAAGTFLADLPGDTRTAFLAAGTQRRHRKGTTVLLQGDAGDTVLLVVEGRVKVVSTTSEGRELVLAVRGAGELLGELTAVAEAGDSRSASVVAIDDVVVRAFTGAVFRQFLRDHPASALVVLRSVVSRLHESDRHRIEFGSLDVPHRLARLLLELAAQHGSPEGDRVELRIALSQEELAGMVAASRETLVRALSSLRARDLVETGRRSIAILDLDALRRYAQSEVAPQGEPRPHG